jgi:hypothetical protein
MDNELEQQLKINEFIIDSIYAKYVSLGLYSLTGYNDEYSYCWHPDYSEWDLVFYQRK